MPDTSDHVVRNRAAWDTWAADYEEPGHGAWTQTDPSWGVWSVPESEVGMLPEDVRGLDAVELGCGTAYVSAWLARRGARPVGIDNSSSQLHNARRFQREFDLSVPLLQADAERLPFADASFDLAISEYGACLWAAPSRGVPEASRVLRPGGRLVFLVNGTILMLCAPDDEEEPPTDRLLRDYFGMRRFEWPDDPSTEFHLGYGDWIRVLRANGFDVEDLIEVRPPEGATSRYPWADPGWARRWPAEEIWKARKRA